MELKKITRIINIYSIIFVFVLISIISFFLLKIHLNQNKIQYIDYIENSSVNYNVNIQENDFYQTNSLKQDKQYISDLIESIEADFRYNIDIKNDLEYNYTYKIDAHINVIDKDTNKEIYSFTETLLDNVEGITKNKLSINEQVLIDYNKYNTTINEFVTSYDLRNVKNLLSVKMYINVEGTNGEFKKEERTINLEMPLTQNTISINTKDDSANQLVALKSNDNKSVIFLILSVSLFAIDVAVLILLIIYSKKTESAEDKYNNELKKILNNYGSYISKIQDEFDTAEYQILRVENFVDLLEIRDTMQLPIIMLENKETMSSCFLIATTNKILYFYSLGIVQYALPGATKTESEDEAEEINV